MGANIKYRFVKKNDKSLGVLSPSLFIKNIQEAFGSFPIVLGKEHLSTLIGMATIFGSVYGSDNPYERMISLIENHGDIEIFAEY